MYAVMELKGHQLMVEKDDVIVVNRMGETRSKKLKVESILFGKKGPKYYIGEPYVKDAYVECEILGDRRSRKVTAFKYRERKSSQSRKGHRQDQTELKVKEIHFK